MRSGRALVAIMVVASICLAGWCTTRPTGHATVGPPVPLAPVGTFGTVAPVRPSANRPGDHAVAGVEEDPDVRKAARLWLMVNPGAGVVICPLGADAPLDGMGLMSGPDGFSGIAEVRSGRLIAVVPPGSGEGTFDFPLEMRGRLEWRDVGVGTIGQCVHAEIEAMNAAGIHGRVMGTPFPETSVNGCGGVVGVVDGAFFLAAEAMGPCQLAVTVFSKGRLATGPRVWVTPTMASDQEVELRYPLASDLRPYSAEEVEGMRSRLEDLEGSCRDCGELVAYFRNELEEAQRARAEDLGEDPPAPSSDGNDDLEADGGG